MNKEIININNKNKYHGYQEWYTIPKLLLFLRANYKNNKIVAYAEHHLEKETVYVIK